MTISTTDSRIPYNGNGVTVAFSFPYRFLLNSDLIVVLRSITGAESTLVMGTHYTIAGAGADAGGTVTMVTAPAVGERLVIYRRTALTQETDYISGDPFPAETHERALDRLTAIAQEQQDDINRTLRFPVSDTVSPDLPTQAVRANKLMAFDSLGNPTVALPVSGSATDLGLQLQATGGAAMVGKVGGGTVQDVLDTVGNVSLSASQADFDTAVAAARSAGGGAVSVPSGAAMAPSTALEVVGEFTNGLLLDGRRAVVTGASTSVDGLLVGNKVGSVAISYFNKFKVENWTLIGAGKVGTAAGIHQQAGAEIQIENSRIRNWPIGLLLEGGLTSDFTNLTIRDNGIGIEGKVYDDGAGGLNGFSPNANSFYGLRNFYNTQAVKYNNNPSGCVNWIGCNFEANNETGNASDGVKVIEMTNAGHHNFFGTHHESNAGQYSMYFQGADASKTLLLAGVENIDATGTNVHIQAGRLSSIASRLTNTSSVHDIYLNTGAKATLIDTEGAVTGDVSAMVALRDGRLGFGVQPVVGNPVVDVRSEPIAASSNIAANFRNDTVQIRFQNTAGTRVGYIQTSASGNHTIWNDNADGGWSFGAGNVARMYIGRSGASAVEPGSDNTTTLGSGALRWSQTFSREFRPGTGAPIWTSGAGTPEGTVTAVVGSLYTRTDGGASTTLYVKESGTGSTGWVAK